MGLFESIEKLINEHGSATILRERIALVKEQHTTLESKLEESRKETLELREEKERLKTDNAQLREKIGSLDKQLRKYSTEPNNDITKEQEILLEKLLHTSVESDVIKAFPLNNPEAVRYHLVELSRSRLIEHFDIGLGVVACNITQEGRRYLIQKGLLK